MRRDTIFYKLFQQYPSLLFQLLENPPENADSYRFDSVAIKEPKFEIDGVFLPPENENPGIVYFCEVQFQKDEILYERVVAESSLYFYRNRARFSDWEAVIIYPSRNIEQSNIYPLRAFLNSDQVHRVYLDELGDIHQLPTWVGVMILTTLEESQAPEVARYLLTKTKEEIPSSSNSVIIEMITTIMMYKFENLNRQEVESMLGITLKQTRVYQEIKEEGREEGLEQGLEQGLKAGRKEGLEEATFNLVMRLLSKRFGKISPKIRGSISNLSLPVLEDLSEDLLDFKTVNDLQIWLEKVED
ncbi:Rpn family recombination-promoting nuclease/putative transposase [Aphanizomenon sp. PH219]|uniref:Rpn family recombination-promoting nuclease/putative transposase n=1 Tax=Dolichospermum heterosporum TAC447 TaxID=747523 RepID=A0ABY5M2Q1_9CYAN|nr:MULTISPECIES: Rpn family recombination-promoting nuclease/putative transposase [Aphanizomenonaceae]MDK2409758.1 Rpn family recombination-promoting nuclease/putative transposase [Aphanizomenon sp. 202]MDK2460779.1 Rpn family recombination-promoting nuclease/putative transposase [Aphanizomenon sp. PH219]UUO16109.1 Rpn family recombination-promoting nuclease/putative transposase [Dolichospermum heterosporum TAC447]